MSWLFSRALVAAYSPAICLDGEPCAPLSVMPTPHKFWRNDKTMESCELSRFGLMCAVLTEDRGAELLTLYRAAFPVRTFQWLEKARALMANAPACGQSSLASLAKYDHVTHTLKTAQLSLIEDLTGCCVTLPRSGSMRNGLVFQRATLALIMNATGYGSSGERFPTPTVHGNNNAPKPGTKRGTGLATHVKKWPTPQASDNRDRGNLSTPAIARRMQKGKQVMLSMCVSSENGRLNPDWVEWLMGWPTGWTDLKPLETAKFHEWQRQHSPRSQVDEVAA